MKILILLCSMVLLVSCEIRSGGEGSYQQLIRAENNYINKVCSTRGGVASVHEPDYTKFITCKDGYFFTTNTLHFNPKEEGETNHGC